MPGYVKWPLAVLAAAAVTAGIFYFSGLSWGVPAAPNVHGAKDGPSYMSALYAQTPPFARLAKTASAQRPNEVVRRLTGANLFVA